MSCAWGVLTRVGGTEDNISVPNKIELFHDHCFFGRFPEPVKNTENNFLHDSQVLIPCAYVSATHFSIGVQRGHPSSMNSYVIRDYSRNGTYINDSTEPIGKHDRTLHPNDTISFIYKAMTCIIYLFTVESSSVQASVIGGHHLTTPFNHRSSKQVHPVSFHTKGTGNDDHNHNKSISDQPVDYEDSSRFASMKSQSEHITEGLNRQIQSLENELRALDERLQIQSNKMLIQTNVIDKYESKMRVDEKTIEGLNAELSEWKERSAASEANCSAIEARCCILTDTIEQNKTDIRELRHKMTAMNEELLSKTEQLDTRRAFVEDNHKMLLAEKDKRKRVQDKLHVQTMQNSSLQDRVDRMSMANQALQSVVADKELSINQLKENYLYLEEKFQLLYKTTAQRQDNYNRLFRDFESLIHASSRSMFSDGIINNDDGSSTNDRDILLAIENQRDICLHDDEDDDHEPVETQFEATYCVETLMQVLPAEDNHSDQNDRNSNHHHHHHHDVLEVTTKRKLCDDTSSTPPPPPVVGVNYSTSPVMEAGELKRARLEVDLERSDELVIPTDDPALPAVVQPLLVCDDIDPIMSDREEQHDQERQYDDDVAFKELEEERTVGDQQEEDREATTLPQDIAVATHEDDPKLTSLDAYAPIHDEEDQIEAKTRMEEQLSVEDMQSTQLPANYKFLFEDEDDEDDDDDDDGSSLQSISSNAADMIENVEPSNIGSSSSTTKSEEFGIVKSASSVDSSVEGQK